jgi:type I restriction enzyme, S subunit
MTLKVLTIQNQDILNNEHNRLDVKFYSVNRFFDELELNYNLKVEYLENLKKTIISGSYIDTYINKKNGIPYLRVGDIKPFCFDENEDDLAYVSKNVAEKIKTQENDILIARTQATTDKLGTASIVSKQNEGWATSQHTTRIRVDENKISPYYLVAYLNSKFFKSQTSLASHGDTRVELTHSQLNKVRVFLPDTNLLNQIEIKVKEIIRCQQKSNELIESAKSEFKDCISLKREFNNPKFFSSDLKSLAEFDIWNATCHLPFYIDNEKTLKNTFKSLSLGEVCDLKKGNEVGSENYEVYLNKTASHYAFIRTSDIINHETDLFPDYFVTKEIFEALGQKLENGDILFTKDGKIGQTALITENDKAIIASGISRIRLKKEKKEKYNLTPEYLFTVLATKETGYYPAIRRTVIGTTIPHLREERLKQIQIPVLENELINSVTSKIKDAFNLKNIRKDLINQVLSIIDAEYEKLLR